ncbi:MAG TPA: SDR family NAD(P)-dependent oxidoreductase [Anaerolineales bacterium]|nr:SDR family NAD(P)-dependent oxidoreductase [Anaerolineales bacterium]
MKFADRYGSWAIVAGASEGLGAEYARQLASRGLNLVLIARRRELLQSLAAQLMKKYAVRTKLLALDLSAPDAAEQIVQKTMDIDLGLLVYNAAYSAVGPFLDRSMDEHLREVHTNIHSPLKLVYLLSQRFHARGRGGVLLMASLSAFQGSPYISTYAATKAFNIVLAESLWEEWRARNVDVLVCISGAVSTPNYLASQPKRTGGLGDRSMPPDQCVEEALEALGKQPYIIPGRMNRLASFVMRYLMPRKMAIMFMGRTLREMYVK